MGVKLTIEQEESPRRALVKTAAVILFALVVFCISVILTLSVAHLIEYGFSDKGFKALSKSYDQLKHHPWFWWNAYLKWWAVFVTNLHKGVFRPGLFLPLLAPLPSLFILLTAYIRSSYSFSFWYVFHHRFAKLADVEKMGLLNGVMLVLGRFQDYVLGLTRPGSVLCFGEAGCGKTSSVAIPSILRSDNACVVAVDNSGTLAKYTSGYRAQLGKVFYFNWDLQDEPDKGNFYPHWNPLGKGNLPPKGEVCDDYLAFLAGYLVSYDRKLNKDNYWEWLAFISLQAFLQFMVSKVSQATANDYFLNQILERGRLSREDKDILLSYYLLMPPQYGRPAMKSIEKEKLGIDDFLPVGSWEGIPEAWKGKELSLSMMTDWLLKSYLKAREEDENHDWKNWLEELLVEAQLFNYNSEAVSGLRQLSYLSKKQRGIVFPMVLKPLKVFRNPAVREKTSSNDFYMQSLRGYKNNDAKKWEPVTVYCTANTKSTKFISRMFLEIMLRQNLQGHKYKGPFPLMVITDDIGQMLKINGLFDCAARAPLLRMAFLFVCNSLHNVENIYGREALENLVANTNYKIVMAEDNNKLSRQLNKLALYATKSVQIPIGKFSKHRKMKKGVADSHYFHRLAKDLSARRNLSIETKGYQLLLAEGFYHCPVLTKNPHFIKDEKFREKSLIDACYGLDTGLRERRNVQDIKIPGAQEVLMTADIGIDDETELDQYMDVIYEQIVDKMQETPDKTTALADDLSSKWKKSPGGQAADKNSGMPKSEEADWWLDEEAFAEKDSNSKFNPFEKK